MANALLRSNKQLVSGYARDTGGNINMTGDYSVTPVYFKFQPPAGYIYAINRMVLHIKDSGKPDAGFYGNNIVLTNGIQLLHQRSGVTIPNETQLHPVITNADYSKFSFNVDTVAFGLGDDSVRVLYDFQQEGAPFELDGNISETLGFYLQDDFSGLVEHTLWFGAVMFPK